MVAKKKFSTMDAADFAVPKIHSALADAILQENAREHAQIPFNRLRPNPRQPRKQFNATHLQELADDIAKNGLIEEIVVRRCPNQAGWFEIVCGERRTRACRENGRRNPCPAFRPVASKWVRRVAAEPSEKF